VGYRLRRFVTGAVYYMKIIILIYKTHHFYIDGFSIFLFFTKGKYV